MNILRNAIDSIALGLEDYESDDPRRIISCTRNLYSGVLLMFKYKLAELSPADSDEVLIKNNILPKLVGGAVTWVGKGKKTVDFLGIRTRFEALDITVEWKRVEKIQKYRNNIEHYYSTESRESLQTLIQNVFIVIQDFVDKYIEEDLKELLGDHAYGVLVNVQEVYDREKQICLASLSEINWESPVLKESFESASCPCCGSTLITIDDPQTSRDDNEFRCKSCDEIHTYSEFAQRALDEKFEVDNYLTMTDGGDPSVISCPHCFEETYILSEQSCVLCGGSVSHTCKICQERIPPEEINDEEICSWCMQVRMKDD